MTPVVHGREDGPGPAELCAAAAAAARLYTSSGVPQTMRHILVRHIREVEAKAP